MHIKIIRFFAAILEVSTLVAPASMAKSSYWYTRHSCQFYASGGRRTPQTEACRRQMTNEAPQIRFCRDQQRRGPVPCGTKSMNVAKSQGNLEAG